MPAGPAVLRFPRGLPPSKQFGERLRLLVVQGGDKGTCYSILGDLIFVGREGCQINLNDTNISRKHAEIGWRGDHYSVRDLGSSNGIVHNGKKVSEAKLSPGDIVLIGLTVLEVYPPGQAKKNDRPLLPGSSRPSVHGTNAAGPVTKEAVKEEAKKQREVGKKKLLIYFALFFVLASAYFADYTATIREAARIPPPEDEGENKPKLKKKEIKEALRDFIPDYTLDTQQRKDANAFFRSGVRELQNKNFRRAFTAFETALTVDPTHELAKIYLKSAKKEMMAELKAMRSAALQAQKSLRLKEARMHWENVLRYLEGETNLEAAQSSADIDGVKLTELLEEAKKALEQLDKDENKPK